MKSILIGFVFFLLSSFRSFFVTTTYSQVIHHRRLRPWPPPESGSGPSPGPSPSPHNKTTPAVFFFGDSIIDTGNNNNLTTEMKCNFSPYGMDFPLGVATGRFSNGKVVSDYICSYSFSPSLSFFPLLLCRTWKICLYHNMYYVTLNIIGDRLIIY